MGSCFPQRAAAALFALVLAVGVPSRDARASSLTTRESERLAHGETVSREHTYEAGNRRYIGGVTYTVLEAAAAEVDAVLSDVEAYKRVLPRTKRARLVGMDGADRLVELVQGNAVVDATYTIRVRRDASQRQFRFWLEPSHPHEIDDAWGFFRLEPFIAEGGAERVLLTYGVLVDVGPGIMRELFEERIRAAILSVPQLVRRYVVEARRTGGGSPVAAREGHP